MVIEKRPGDTRKLVFFEVVGEQREEEAFEGVATEDMKVGITDRRDLVVFVGSDDSGFGSQGVLLWFC